MFELLFFDVQCIFSTISCSCL